MLISNPTNINFAPHSQFAPFYSDSKPFEFLKIRMSMQEHSCTTVYCCQLFSGQFFIVHFNCFVTVWITIEKTALLLVK